MNAYKPYSGIGSRQTPKNILDLMTIVGRRLALKGYTLRSGGADGADLAFEHGAELEHGAREIFLPWKGFNKSTSQLYGVTTKALELASDLHPAWDQCNNAARKLHARNCYQILGKELNSPSEFVICWTDQGGMKGGTATAIKLAKAHNIPVYNLYDVSESEVLTLIEQLDLVKEIKP